MRKVPLEFTIPQKARTIADSKGLMLTYECDVLLFSRLVWQTAACVIQACREYPKDKTLPDAGIGKILFEQMDWRGFQLRDALTSQVVFLYSVVIAQIDGKSTKNAIVENVDKF